MNNRQQSGGIGAAFLHEFPLLITLLVAGVFFLLIMGFKGCSKKTEEDPALQQPTGTYEGGQIPPATGAIPPASQTETDPQDTVDPNVPPETSDSQPADTTASSESPETEPPAPAYPEGFTTVDESYFEDALFIGDSRTDGLCLYCPVGDAKHYSGTSMTIFKIMDTTDSAYGYAGIRALLQGQQFGKIYIMFGINEAGYDTDYFLNQYRNVITEIRSYQPNAIIYIQSILYVTQNHEANNPVFATANLKEKNAGLKEMANGVDIFYLEVNDCLNDGTDHLPSDYTGDGVHLKASYYQYWHDYLLEHAIVNAAHPWPIDTTD